jgi:hypothetical protein
VVHVHGAVKVLPCPIAAGCVCCVPGNDSCRLRMTAAYALSRGSHVQPAQGAVMMHWCGCCNSGMLPSTMSKAAGGDATCVG